MERLANTKPLPIPERRPHPRPTFRDPTRSMLGWRSLALRWRRRLRGWRWFGRGGRRRLADARRPSMEPSPRAGRRGAAGERERSVERRALGPAGNRLARAVLLVRGWIQKGSYAGEYRRARTEVERRQEDASEEGRKEGRIYGHETQRADGATAYGHTTPTRPTPSYLRDYHNDD